MSYFKISYFRYILEFWDFFTGFAPPKNQNKRVPHGFQKKIWQKSRIIINFLCCQFNLFCTKGPFFAWTLFVRFSTFFRWKKGSPLYTISPNHSWVVKIPIRKRFSFVGPVGSVCHFPHFRLEQIINEPLSKFFFHVVLDWVAKTFIWLFSDKFEHCLTIR